MGIFGFWNKKVEEEEDNKLELLTKEKVERHAQVFDMVLKQKNMSVKTARVCFVIDTSISMQGSFRNGTVQSIVERIIPLALRFDDDGELETYWFSDECGSCKSATIDNITGYVDAYVMDTCNWSGTRYSPIIKKVSKHYGISKPSDDPTFVIFVTDGDNFDKDETRKAIIKASEMNIFWKFVGVGTDKMNFLEELDDMEGRVIDNANFVQIRNINSTSDEQLYKMLLEEYDEWIDRAKSVGILK